MIYFSLIFRYVRFLYILPLFYLHFQRASHFRIILFILSSSLVCCSIFLFIHLLTVINIIYFHKFYLKQESCGAKTYVSDFVHFKYYPRFNKNISGTSPQHKQLSFIKIYFLQSSKVTIAFLL